VGLDLTLETFDCDRGSASGVEGGEDIIISCGGLPYLVLVGHRREDSSCLWHQ
jgi:hypothetical protein